MTACAEMQEAGRSLGGSSDFGNFSPDVGEAALILVAWRAHMMWRWSICGARWHLPRQDGS